MDIYEKIEALLKARKMSKRQLAKKINVSPSTLTSSFLRKSKSISFEMISRIAIALDVDANYLLEDASSDIALEQITSDRQVIETDKNIYISNNPLINHDGVVGKIVYSHDFQSVILSLIECLLKKDVENYIVLNLLESVIEMIQRPDFTSLKIDDFQFMLDMIDVAMTTSDPETYDRMVKIVISYFDKHKMVDKFTNNGGDQNT